jgi:UDP-N-acetylmuramoyl-L-alanyl-D-glutamate--2,6-diaminopimelate ligase
MPLLPSKRYIQIIKNLFWHLPRAIIFNLIYGFPAKKLTLIGVTGTDGKTTTVHLIHQALLNSGINAGLSSTVSSPGLHTTSPDPKYVQKFLKELVESQATHAVIEVTAHAIDQFRYFGCHFHIAILTNTSHEHLDDFLDLPTYISTKSKLLQNADIAITNRDDPSYRLISSQKNNQLITYGVKNKSDYQAKNITISPDRLSFEVNHTPLSTNSNYHYQTYNILAAFAAAQKLNIPLQVFQQTIKNFPEIKGRREEVQNDLKIRCLIDFAHTPQALEATLSSLRNTTKGRLIAIFGATGGRDQTKRPLMGKVVSKMADIAFITSDDTRNEKVEDINRQIITGINPKDSRLVNPGQLSRTGTPKIPNGKFAYFNIPNRQEAFNLAIRIARPGDTIVACGKGHETTILHGSTEYPWSESQAYRTAIHLNQLTHESTV